MADVRDALVPVTLYVAVDSGNFLEDVLWNPLDGRDAMASFALGFCRDVGLPTTQVPTLVSQIARQVGSWLEQAQRASRSAEAQSARAPPTTAAAAAAAAAAKDVREIAYECWLGDSRYCDRVLWDVSDPHASPEDFAMATVKDLGLPDECALPIAVALRKQVRVNAGSGDVGAGLARGRGSNGDGRAFQEALRAARSTDRPRLRIETLSARAEPRRFREHSAWRAQRRGAVLAARLPHRLRRGKLRLYACLLFLHAHQPFFLSSYPQLCFPGVVLRYLP